MDGTTKCTTAALVGSMGLALSLVSSSSGSDGNCSSITPPTVVTVSPVPPCSRDGSDEVSVTVAAVVTTPTTATTTTVVNPGCSNSSVGSYGAAISLTLPPAAAKSLDIESGTVVPLIGEQISRMGTTLPTLSVSEPSPPHDKLECL